MIKAETEVCFTDDEHPSMDTKRGILYNDFDYWIRASYSRLVPSCRPSAWCLEDILPQDLAFPLLRHPIFLHALHLMSVHSLRALNLPESLCHVQEDSVRTGNVMRVLKRQRGHVQQIFVMHLGVVQSHSGRLSHNFSSLILEACSRQVEFQ